MSSSIQQGFILSRQARDVRSSFQINHSHSMQTSDQLSHNKTLIEIWLATDSGPVQLLIQDQQVVFFITKQDQIKAEQLIADAFGEQTPIQMKSVPLKTFEQNAVLACYTPNNQISYQAKQLFNQHGIITFEDDIRLTDRYLMERFIRGGVQFIGDRTQKQGYQSVRQAKCKPSDYKPNLSVVSLDIECSEKGILYSVGLDSTLDSRVIMIGEAPNPLAPIQKKNEELHIEWVANELALLKALIQWFRTFDPDIIIGWNVIDFDFRLLDKRAKWHKLPLAIARGSQNLYFRQSKTTQQGFVSIPGRVVLDGIDTLKTATYHFNSWTLESVSQQLLGEGKIIHDPFNRMDEINRQFREDKHSLARYNLQDCRLVTRIFDQTHLLQFAIERTQLTGVELDRIGGSVAAFTNLYLPQLHRAGYIAPNLQSENWLASPGGYVMDSDPGLYHSVLVLDFKSLYPAIIRTFLIDPLGLVEGLQQSIGKQDDQAVAGFRGGQFHRDKHFLPKMIEQLWQARDVAKRNKEAAFSQAIKIIMNSFYGVLGSSGCRFFDTRLASSITMRGHEIMKQTRVLIEAQGYQVIYGDTDSLFVSLIEPHTPDKADKIGHHLVTTINHWWQQHIQEEFHLTSALELEYETHYQRFLMPTIRGAETGSKKRYCGMIVEQGVEKMVFKGLESARTDWTALSHHFQQTLYNMVFHDKDPQSFIRQYVDDTLAGKFDDDLVYQKRLRRKLNEYLKNIPPQVRAAKLADDHNARLGRPLQYQNKGRIQYLFTINGPEPKDYLHSPIDYQHYIDKQLKPVADAILPFIGLDFESVIAPQIDLF
ncbi:DNA polymerase II [Vibrio sp. S11_S32]|uniref:DNA polymerase II n=1 Tax=Vibrio sp. S11_S32 TaxID=2720225 RepID=UPI0016819689|nr:DNA polymerase II [Vibrio sp. S11_S32]